MDKLRNYEVSFSGLKNGKHHFRFEIAQSFLQLFDTENEFSNPKIVADVELDKHTTFLEFLITTKGTVDLICDITGADFTYPVENQVKVLVKFGEEYDDSDDEVLTIPASDHQFNVAHLIYENIVLSVPMKKVCPQISDEDRSLLEKYAPQQKEEADEADPRWAALNKLKKN